jgi:glycosyltransferase involved in cell wall biosynthesis
MTPRATVIIPSRNSAETLGAMLESVLSQTVPRGDYEVVVVDDDSTDDTPEMLARLEHDGLRWARQRRAGAGAARNRALAMSTGDVVVFLDDDAFVRADFLARHLEMHARDRHVLAAGGIIEVRLPHVAAGVPSAWSGYHRHPMPGGNASVRREHLAAVGGFDESFDTYGWQDQELAERLLAHGLRRRFVRAAPIYHYKPAEIVLDAQHELMRELDRGRMGARFYHKHPSVFVGITTKLWPPLRGAHAMLNRAFGLEEQATRILDGTGRLSPFRGARASLLRAHVEIQSGRAELERLARSVPLAGCRDVK